MRGCFKTSGEGCEEALRFASRCPNLQELFMGDNPKARSREAGEEAEGGGGEKGDT